MLTIARALPQPSCSKLRCNCYKTLCLYQSQQLRECSIFPSSPVRCDQGLQKPSLYLSTLLGSSSILESVKSKAVATVSRRSTVWIREGFLNTVKSMKSSLFQYFDKIPIKFKTSTITKIGLYKWYSVCTAHSKYYESCNFSSLARKSASKLSWM